jgi:PBSX family phage portal protein
MSQVKRKSTGTSNAGYIEIDIMKTAEEKIVKRSNQLENFEELYGDVLTPSYEPKDLLRIVEESSNLKQYIKAMATNIAMFGHVIKHNDDFDYDREKDEEIKNEADKEWDKLTRLYKYINPTEGLKKVIEKMVIDRESIGWGTIEIMRDGKGEVSHIEYCRAANIRICKLNSDDSKPVEFEVLEKDDNGEYTKQTYYKKFKKFVQIVGGKKVYFKEFGDSRQLNYSTGKYGKDIPEDKRATEIAFFPIHDPSTDYGIPRWTGSLVDVIGNRSSEVLNFAYFESGTILPAAIIVDGGQLTDESVEAVRGGKGIGNAFKLLLLETAPFEDEEFSGDTEKKNKVSTKIEKLADTMNKDGMFQEYQKNSKEKVRDNFRLPPIFTGQSTDYTRSTADTSRIIAEEQIFVPERADITSVFNTIINNELGIKYVEMQLQGPVFSDIVDKSQALTPYIQGGAVTPNMLIEPLEELLGIIIEPLPDEIGNIPIEILKLQMAMKQQDSSETKIELEKSDTIDKSIDVIYEMMSDIKKYLSDNHE